MIPGSANPLLLTGAAEAEGYAIERSLRFNSADSAYLSRTPASAGNRKTWTWAGWVKRSSLGGIQSLFTSTRSAPTNDQSVIYFWGDNLWIGSIDSSAITWSLVTTALYRDLSAWMHVIVSCDTTNVVTTDRLRLYVNGSRVTSFSTATYPALNYETHFNRTFVHGVGYNVAFAVYPFSGYLADIHFIDGQALDPTSFGEFDTNGVWQPIAYTGTYGTNGFHLPFSDNSTAAALGTDTSGNGNDWTVNNIKGFSSTGNYAAYVYASNATYDGTATGTSYYTGAGSQFNGFDGATNTYVGGENVAGSWVYFRPTPSLSGVSQLRVFAQSVETIYVNGSAATVSPSLPDGTSQWYSIVSPPATVTEIAVQGQVASAAAARFSAIEVNGVVLIDNSFAASNDSLVDVPTNGTETDTGVGGEVRGNYATLNPLDITSGMTLSNGNLEVAQLAGADKGAYGTIGVSSGKWYWEVQCTAGVNSMVGIADLGKALAQREYPDTAGGGLYYYQATGGLYGYLGGSFTNTPYGAAFASPSDVVGIALDMDNGNVNFYKNGVDQGVANTSSLLGKTIVAAIGNGGATASNTFNFGQRPFAYPAPSGFKALCTTNLDDPQTITTSGSYTGNGVADGPFVYLNGVPTAMTVNGNAVTFGTEADKLSNGFKIRTTSTTYNQNASTYNYSITGTGDPFKIARAQANP